MLNSGFRRPFALLHKTTHEKIQTMCAPPFPPSEALRPAGLGLRILRTLRPDDMMQLR